jgi:hypothetical protein
MKQRIKNVLLLSAILAANLPGEEPRFVTENGITYRETREIERRPKAETHWEERTQTVYKTEYVTELREQTHTVWVPITEYTYQPQWQNRFNLFAEPTVSYQLRPVTRWEARTQTQQVPVTVQKTVPETKIVKAPVRSLGFAEHEYVQRVVVNGAPAYGPRNPVVIAKQGESPASTGRLASPTTPVAAPNTVQR